MSSRDHEPTPDPVRTALEATPALPEGDATAAFARVVHRGRVRRRARRTAAVGALALVVGVGAVGATALTGGGEAQDDLQVGTDGGPGTGTAGNDAEGHGVTVVEDVDLVLFESQLLEATRAAGSACPSSDAPVVLPTIGADERYVVERMPSWVHLDATWAPAGRATVQEWLGDAERSGEGPTLVIAPIAFASVPQPDIRPDESGPPLATGSSWVQCDPGGAVVRLPYEIEAWSRQVVPADEPPTEVDPSEVPALGLVDDARTTVSPGARPPAADLSADAVKFDGSHAWLVVAKPWCASVGVDRPAGIEVVQASPQDQLGGLVIDGRPGIRVPWDHPLGNLPRVQVVDASWDPEARPWPETHGVARATFDVHCGGVRATVHYLAVQVEGIGAWQIRWGSEPPQFQADGSLPEDVHPEPDWQEVPPAS